MYTVQYLKVQYSNQDGRIRIFSLFLINLLFCYIIEPHHHHDHHHDHDDHDDHDGHSFILLFREKPSNPCISICRCNIRLRRHRLPRRRRRGINITSFRFLLSTLPRIQTISSISFPAADDSAQMSDETFLAFCVCGVTAGDAGETVAHQEFVEGGGEDRGGDVDEDRYPCVAVGGRERTRSEEYRCYDSCA